MMCDEKTKSMTIALKIENFLLMYRNTPNSINGLTPNDLIFSFRPRTLLTIVNKRSVNDTTPSTTTKQVQRHREIKSIEFNVNEEILCKAEGNTRVVWLKGVIVKRESTSLYKVKLENGRVRSYHGDQLRKYNKRHDEIFIPQKTRETVETTAQESNVETGSTNTGETNSELETTVEDVNETETSESSPDIAQRLRQKSRKQYYEPKNRKRNKKSKRH